MPHVKQSVKNVPIVIIIASFSAFPNYIRVRRLHRQECMRISPSCASSPLVVVQRAERLSRLILRAQS